MVCALVKGQLQQYNATLAMLYKYMLNIFLTWKTEKRGGGRVNSYFHARLKFITMSAHMAYMHPSLSHISPTMVQRIHPLFLITLLLGPTAFISLARTERVDRGIDY